MFKNVLSVKYIPAIILLITILLSSIIILFNIFNTGLVGLDEFKYVDWSINIFNDYAVLSFFRPLFYFLNYFFFTAFGLNDYSAKIPNIFLFLTNLYLIYNFSNGIIKNSYYKILTIVLYALSPSVIVNYTILTPLPLASFFILLNFTLLKKIFLKKDTNSFYIFILSIISILQILVREELFFLFFINFFSLIFFKRTKIEVLLKFYFLPFILFSLLVILFFWDKIFIKEYLSVFLNVISRDANYFIREYYYFNTINLNHLNSSENIVKIFLQKINKIFSKYDFINSYIVFFTFIFIFFNKTIRNKKNIIFILSLNVWFYILFYLLIRVGDRLLIIFFPIINIIIIYFIEQLIKIKSNFKLNVYFLLLFFFFIIFNIFFYTKKKMFKPTFSDTQVIHKFLKENNLNNKKLLILPSYNYSRALPQKYFHNSAFSEYYGIQSKVYYFTNTVNLNSEIIYSDNLFNINDFFKKNNIGYILYDDTENFSLIYKDSTIKKIGKFLNSNDFKKKIKKANDNLNFLRYYNANLDDYFLIDSYDFDQLILDKVIKYIRYNYSDGDLKISNEDLRGIKILKIVD